MKYTKTRVLKNGMYLLSDSKARKMGYNPVFIAPAWVLAGKVIFPSKIWMAECMVCDVIDENTDNFEILNGNMLIEYPKRSKEFYCSCCFQNCFPMSVVKRKLWGEEE
jgi:hypothetical protein